MTGPFRQLSMLWGNSSLQRRIALSAGIVTTVLVLVFSAIVGSMLARGIKSATDQDLRMAAQQFEQRAADSHNQPLWNLGGQLSLERPPPRGDWPGTIDAQLLAPSGNTRFGTLEVTPIALEVATGERGASFEEMEVDDRFIRVFNLPVIRDDGQAALRVWSDITTPYKGLERARLLSIVVGLLAGLCAAIVTRMLGRHLIAPVTAVADAVSSVRSSGALPERLEGAGPDELGTLVNSFNGMLDDLRQSREQQRRLVADASHELRTPLTRLRLKIEFIHTQPQLPAPERCRLIEGAVADLSLLSDLVAELLELAAEGSSAEQSQPLQLANIVSTEVDRFRTTSGRAVDLATTPGLVQTRPRQITRALTNLLVNADKYSPSTSAISVKQVGSQIEVRDRGPGIPVEERNRVFDRFYRGVNCQTVDGSGLGLAIVESVARVNGGTAWIRDPSDGEPGTIVGFSVGPIPSSDREPEFRPKAIQRRS